MYNSENSRTIVIIEDEFIIATDLQGMLIELGYEVLGIAQTPPEAIELMNKLNPDLFLLDISLNSDIDGVHLAEILSLHKKPFIFTTALTDDETIERASKTAPYGYLVKPYKKKDLKISLEIAISRSASLHGTASEAGTSDFVFIKTKIGLEKVELGLVQWMQADDYYTRIIFEDCDLLATITLKELEKRIESSDFVRVHRSYLVNFKKVESIIGNQVIVNGESIPIGRSYKSEVMKRLKLI
jgi:DNA-binding LytR/AlgR family response regulator